MKARSARFALLGVAAVLVATIALKMAPPRLIALPLGVSPIGGNPKWVLLNPFRNRAPERTAHAFFTALTDGDCQQVRRLSTGLKMPNDSTCEDFPNQNYAKGDEYRRLLAQRLRDRTDTGDKCAVWYSNDGYGGNWLALQRDGTGWKVTEFWKVW